MSQHKKVSVVVLGDIGRSPRMQYHALSLARSKFDVDLIGYAGSKPLPDITNNVNIKITNLTPLPTLRGPKILQYVLKTFWQTLTLFIILTMKRSDFVLCQNPPAIPTLLVCWVHCLLTGAKFIIDWHNYAYTIMALSHGENHLLVRIAKRFEFFFGAKAHANLCVTKAMKRDLLDKNIEAKVLYDRPADIFHPITNRDKHDFLCRISGQYSEFGANKISQLNDGVTSDNNETILTEWNDGEILNKDPRPGVLFSSTSWTPDEDFQILLSALEDYDTTSLSSKLLPKLICVITGKGPMKDHYIKLIKKKKLKNVTVVTPWLEALDYPKMVASADLGVCLHTSSSGLDLPMKVVDMFGSGLPVCAFKYQCLDELVRDGENGYTFENSEQLASKIKLWFQGFPRNVEQNNVADEFKENIKNFFNQKWEDNWEKRARALFS